MLTGNFRFSLIRYQTVGCKIRNSCSIPAVFQGSIWREQLVLIFQKTVDAVCSRVICCREPSVELSPVFERKAKATRRLTPLSVRQSTTRIGKLCHPHTPRMLTTNFRLHLSRYIANGCGFQHRLTSSYDWQPGTATVPGVFRQDEITLAGSCSHA